MNKKIISALALVTALALTFTAAHFACRSVMKTLYPIKFNEFVEENTKEYNLHNSFVFAVIKCESSFDKNAVSPVGAMGLMQIMPDTFSWINGKLAGEYKEQMLFEPETAVRFGCYLYRYLIDKFGCEETAVAAYHAGAGNVSKWLKNSEYSSDGKTLKKIPFPSTEKYVKKVMQTKRIYERLYDFK